MARGKSFCLLSVVLCVPNMDLPPCTPTFGGLYSSRRGKLKPSAATTIGGSVVIVVIVVIVGTVGTVGMLRVQDATIREERIPHDQHSEHSSRFLFSQR